MKKYLFSLVIFVLSISFAMAQGTTISGSVSDKTGPLPGASVVEKGQTTNGVMTDIDGKFKLALKGNSQTVIISMIGYVTREVSVAKSTNVEVELLEDATSLDEVMVVGFGTQKRANVTGAVSQISGVEIRQNPSASIQNTLMGRLPGFTSQQRSGQPGSDASTFNIRGANSFTATANPLVIVDDVEYSLPLSDIDPDQIESISILKDAATTAIYGIKGADGVVLITTRRGKSGKPQVSFRSEMGFQSPTIPFDFLGSYDVARLRNQAAANDGKAPVYTQEDLDHYKNGTDPYGHPDVDWAKTILRKNSTQTRNNLNISGGTEKARYFVSVGHLFQNGIMKDFSTKESDFNSNYYYERYNFRSNIDIKATKTLAVGVDLSGYFGEQNNPWLRGTSNNPFFELYDYKRLPPWAYPVYNPDGTYGGNNTKGQLSNLAYNVVGRMTHLGYERSIENGMLANITAKQNLSSLTKGLSARVMFGYNVANSFSRKLTRQSFPSYVYDPKQDSYELFDPGTKRMPIMNVAYSPGRLNRRVTFQANLNYDRTFNKKHHIYALALNNTFSATQGSNIPTNFIGYAFRLGYDYKGKYMIEGNAGYNGSDRFLTQEQFNWFPAASIGWNIAEEPFFKNSFDFVNMLKVRASYGKVGKDYGAGNYAYEQIYHQLDNIYSFGEIASGTSNNADGVREGVLANPNVRWEMEESSNLGLDIDAFNGKLKFSGDMFERYRYDILRGRQSIPAYAGASFPIANYAKLSTTGFELDLTHRNNVGQFYYSVNGNVSVAKTIIVEGDEATPAMSYQAQTGGYMGRVLGYIFDGFYTEENIDASPKPNIAVAPGDIRYKDLDNDGMITSNDKTRLKYPNLPNTIYGFNVSMGYKGFAVAATLQAATNFTIGAIRTQIVPFVSNLRSVHLDTWTPENQDASLPRLLPTWDNTINDPTAYASDFWNKRGDYLRLRTAEVSYTFPSNWTDRIRLQNLRVYANGSNLFTWMLVDKDIYNLDPESVSGSAIMQYPQQKVINFGVHVTF